MSGILTDEQIATQVAAAGFVLDEIDRGQDGSVAVFYSVTKGNAGIFHTGYVVVCPEDLEHLLPKYLARTAKLLGVAP